MRESGNAGRQLLRRIIAFGVLISAATLPTTIATRAQEGGQSWTYTGSLNAARFGHTATLLPNGKVLVVGGSGGHTPELYDPQAGTWSVTGSLNAPRLGFTTTLLGNGKVLVAGGLLSSGDVTKTAELYDSTTGEWSFTGNLSTRRAEHTATLLANGKVLIAGGGLVGAFSAHNTAELYDPVTGTFSLTGNLSGTRVSHGATLLQDGRVLVAGGCRDEECFFFLGSAELYDPNTERWTVTGDLAVPVRSPNLTALPNGNVLTVGGVGKYPPFLLNTAELYNPATGRWSYTVPPIKHRSLPTVTVLPDGQVLVVGGSSGTEVLNSSESYNPVTGEWKTTSSLNSARLDHTATLLNNGKALIVGGYANDIAQSSAELRSTTGPGTLVSVSAASYHLKGLSSDSIAASFGTSLATASISVNTLPLPTEIAGTTIKVKDSAGTERLARLLYVSPTQVNYQIPAAAALGGATVTITSGDGSFSSGIVLIKPVAPSLFAANGNGQGVAAALALRVKADGSQSYEEVVQFDAAQNRFIARPLDLGPESDQVYLVLFGTGIRSRRSLSAVITTIGGVYAAVSFAGVQPEFAGVDQVNVLVSRSLMGRGEVDVLLTVEAQMANPVRIEIK